MKTLIAFLADQGRRTAHRRMVAWELAVLWLATAMELISCSRDVSAGPKQKRPQGAPVPVLVSRAVEQEMAVQIRAIGNVQPYSKVTIRSQITGQLVKVHFQEGQEVKKADLLCTIDPRPAQAALAQARANLARDEALLENARIEFDREKRLFDSALISQDEFEKARANLNTLQGTVLGDHAAITIAELNLEFTSIRSPLDGVTGNLLVYPGNIVKAPDDSILTINQIHPAYISFAVPEQDLSVIRKEMGQRPLGVGATFQNMSVVAPEGQLTFIDNAVDPTTGMIQLKATFSNENNALWPGQFVHVALTLSTEPRAVVVPSSAVQMGQNGEFIYVVKADQTVEMRPLTIGIARDGQTIVESGLNAGEIVVTDGQLRLVPGAKVNVQAANQSEPGVSAQSTAP